MNKSAIVATATLCVLAAAGAGFWFGAQRARSGAGRQLRRHDAAEGRGGVRRRADGRRSGEGRAAAAAANDHGRGQPALRRIGDAASRSGRPRQRDPVQGRPERQAGDDARAARSGDQRGGSAAGESEPDAREEQVRSRRRAVPAQFHLGPGEGRGREQPARRGGRRRAGRGAPRQDGDQGAVLRRHRPARRVGRRLREGGRRHGQPRVDRSAEGRLPRA